MKKNTHPLLAIILLASFCFHSCTDPLEEEFKNPPDWAKPHSWWHWVNGNVSKSGITRDLESLKEVGIGGVQMFSVLRHFQEEIDRDG
jgi:hypothetical protein